MIAAYYVRKNTCEGDEAAIQVLKKTHTTLGAAVILGVNSVAEAFALPLAGAAATAGDGVEVAARGTEEAFTSPRATCSTIPRMLPRATAGSPSRTPTVDKTPFPSTKPE